MLNIIVAFFFATFSFLCTAEILSTRGIWKIRIVLPFSFVVPSILTAILAVFVALFSPFGLEISILGYVVGALMALQSRKFPPRLFPIAMSREQWEAKVDHLFFPSGSFTFTGESNSPEPGELWDIFIDERTGKKYEVSVLPLTGWVTIRHIRGSTRC